MGWRIRMRGRYARRMTREAHVFDDALVELSTVRTLDDFFGFE